MKCILRKIFTAVLTAVLFCTCTPLAACAGTAVPAAHTSGDWLVYKTPTATKTGILATRCAVCGEMDDAFAITLGFNNKNGIIVYVTDQGQLLRNKWLYVNGAWHYFDARGIAKRNAWVADSVGMCYVDGGGRMVTNRWIHTDGKWYYCDGKGRRMTNCWRKDSKGWVCLGSDGAMLTNAWCKDSKGWCYVDADGYAVTDCWKKDSHGWIYLDGNGSMTKSKWIKTNGKWYYIGANGYMTSNKWQKDSKGWVYLGADGAMVKNKWVKDSKGWCYVGANGYAVTNCWKKDSHGWLYLDANGSMTKSKWVQSSQRWYYLDADGYMVTDTWEKDAKGKWRYINASGYITAHALDYHSHTFAPASYISREKCSCGAQRGKRLTLPFCVRGDEPFVCQNKGETVKISNIHHELVVEGRVVYIFFDVQFCSDAVKEYYGAKFTLSDANGNHLDNVIWLEDRFAFGNWLYNEYVGLDLENWNGETGLVLTVCDPS